jgi:cell division protein FtsQ
MSQSVLSLPRRIPAVDRLVPSRRSATVAALVVVAAGCLYVVARETPMFAVRRVEVQGGPPAVAQEARLALARFDGTNLLALDGTSVLRALEALPTVVTAAYDRDFPHTLRVRIVAESPVAVLRRGAGAWLASARGRVIGTVARSRYPSLPRIWLPSQTAIAVGGFLDGDAAASARALREFVATQFAHRVLWARVLGRQLTLGLRSGLRLEFGAPTALDLKLAVVRSILPTLARPSDGGPTYLDVSVPERPVAGTNTQVGG